MAEKTQTPPAQTQAEIVAALRAENAKTNSAVWNVLRTLPLLPLGGAVDLGNAIAGTFAGKGFLKPLVEKPVGGLKDLKERFRIPELAPDDTLGQGLEVAASMMSPGGAAKAIIIPFSAAQATRAGAGVSKIADQARSTYARTGDNTKVLAESNKALKDANFPMAIQGFYFGPDGKMRASLSNQAFKGNFNPQLFQVDPAGNISLGKPLLGGQNTIHAETVLPHESLYKLMPELKDTRIRHDPTMTDPLILGSYNRKTNTVNLPGVIQADPNHSLISTLIHELTHAGQNLGKTRSGSAPAIDDLIGSLDEARKMGTFTTQKEIDDAINTLSNIEFSRMFPGSNIPNLPANPDEYIFNVYRSIFGEVEARQSQNMTPGKLPNIWRLERSY